LIILILSASASNIDIMSYWTEEEDVEAEMKEGFQAGKVAPEQNAAPPCAKEKTAAASAHEKPMAIAISAKKPGAVAAFAAAAVEKSSIRKASPKPSDLVANRLLSSPTPPLRPLRLRLQPRS
jgi:hypothetical protein